MATINFEIELINELTGHSLSFEYDFEEFGLSRQELDDLADDLVMGRDRTLYDEILQNISIVPTVSSIDYDYGDDDENTD
jgi:hypothetical protein